MRFVLTCLLAFGSTWGIVEGIVTLWDRLLGVPLLVLLVLVSVVAGMINVWSPTTIAIDVASSGLKVLVVAGDLFATGHDIAIGADDLFLIGHKKLVNENSLMGQLRDEVGEGRLAKVLGESLNAVSADEVVKLEERLGIWRKGGRYPIGTTVCIASIARNRIFVTAQCRIDVEQLRGSATPQEVWFSLISLWRAIRDNPRGNAVRVPLLGSGQSGTGLDAGGTLNLMLASLLVAHLEAPMTDEIHIVVHESALDSLDLAHVRDGWKRA